MSNLRQAVRTKAARDAAAYLFAEEPVQFIGEKLLVFVIMFQRALKRFSQVVDLAPVAIGAPI